MTPPSILRWFAPPDLACPDLRQRAAALWIASWPFFAVVTVMLAIAVLVEPSTLARRATTVASVGVLVGILHAISRAGRPVLASWILSIGLSIIVTQRAWITGGIHAPVAVFYVLFIVIAGVLIGARGAVVTASVCLVGALVLTVGTEFGMLAPRPGAGSALAGFVFVALTIGLALVLQAMVAHRSRRERQGLEAVQMHVHDMRSPLLALFAHLEWLRDEVRDSGTKDVAAAIGNASTLRRMTNSLLDLSRLEAGQMPVQRAATDLAAVATAVVADLRVVQPSRDVDVETDGDATCNCDRELTRRIIENLVSNAMKHTAPGVPVRVTVSAFDGGVRIAVADEGPGVPRERRARIFETYGSSSLKSGNGYESSGLGLAFCKLAAQAQGGTIRIEDGAERGSVFVVELPR